MASIINKPFFWANRIVQAVFRGHPNLVTTSDLNRQMEAFKREMYLLHEASGAVISDFSGVANYTGVGHTAIRVTLTYVFCKGVKFDFSYKNQLFQVPIGDPKGRSFMVYAKKTLVTYNTDPGHSISGATFTDGTSQAAADHFVYTDHELVLDYDVLPGSNFSYPMRGDKEYVCTLAVTGTPTAPIVGRNNSPYYFKVLCVPMGSHIVDGTPIRYENNQFTLGHSLQPLPNDNIKECIRKLWGRQYTLEKRLFNETKYGSAGIVGTFSVNGLTFSGSRQYNKRMSTVNFGSCELSYSFYLVGNICFVSGNLTVEKNLSSNPLNATLSFFITEAENEMPKALSFSSWVFLTMAPFIGPNATDIPVYTGLRGTLAANAISFKGIPSGGVSAGWYGVYPFSSDKFWDYAPDDRFGFFNDMRETGGGTTTTE